MEWAPRYIIKCIKQDTKPRGVCCRLSVGKQYRRKHVNVQTLRGQETELLVSGRELGDVWEGRGAEANIDFNLPLFVFCNTTVSNF